MGVIILFFGSVVCHADKFGLEFARRSVRVDVEEGDFEAGRVFEVDDLTSFFLGVEFALFDLVESGADVLAERAAVVGAVAGHVGDEAVFNPDEDLVFLVGECLRFDCSEPFVVGDRVNLADHFLLVEF